jgi:hypothetical protein
MSGMHQRTIIITTATTFCRYREVIHTCISKVILRRIRFTDHAVEGPDDAQKIIVWTNIIHKPQNNLSP